MDKEITIKQSQYKQFLLILVGIFMVATNIFIFCSDVNSFLDNIILKIVGVFGIIFFGICLIFVINRFINPKDILIINQSGITDNSSITSIGFIPWKDVKSTCIKSVFTETFIAIEVENYKEKTKLLPLYKRIMINLNIKIGYKDVLISLKTTTYNYKEVLELINKFNNNPSTENSSHN